MSKSRTTTAETVAPVPLARMRRAPTHPGEMLLEEFLRPLDVSQAEAARRMGIPLNRLNTIIKGKRGVSPETAILFAALTGTSAEFWLNLQTRHDLWHALRRMPVPKLQPLAEHGVHA